MKHTLTKLLMEQFDADYVHVTDNSHRHAGHKGIDKVGDSHFHVTVITSQFEGVSLVQRHRMVYDRLKDPIKMGVHAIEITAKTPNEA